MGSTVWCDVCSGNFEHTVDRKIVTISVTPEGQYGGETFSLDSHESCLVEIIGRAKELSLEHQGNGFPNP